MHRSDDGGPSITDDGIEAINWHDVIVAGTTLGWAPNDIYQATLPELLMAIEGQRNKRGIKPAPQPMSRERLNELVETYQ